MTNGRPTPDELLSAYHDGELSAAERQEVERFLEDSADARAELEDYRALSEMLRTLPAEPVPDGLRAAVMRRVERELLIPNPAAPVAAVKPRRKLWMFAGLITAAAAVLLIGVVSFRDRTGGLGGRRLAEAGRAVESRFRTISSVPAGPAGGAPRDFADGATQPELVRKDTVAEHLHDAPALASFSNVTAAEALSLPKGAALGDVFSYLEQTPDGEVVVVQATVVDVRQALNELQILLTKNSIPTQPVAFDYGGFGVGLGGATESLEEFKRSEKAPLGELAVYIESDPDRINAALDALGREKTQFVDFQLAGVLNPTTQYGTQLGLYAKNAALDDLTRSESAPEPDAAPIDPKADADAKSVAAKARAMWMDPDASGSGRTRARFSVPNELEYRDSEASQELPALSPSDATTRTILPQIAPKPDLPLPRFSGASPAPVANAPLDGPKAAAAEPADPAAGYQAIVSVSKAELQKQVQPVQDRLESLLKENAGTPSYEQAKAAKRQGRAPVETFDSGPDRNAAAAGDRSLPDARPKLEESRQQVQRRLRLLVVLESQGEAAERAADVKAESSRPPVEAPAPPEKG